ncbi:hemerythrin domain-containing protein [Campylobacter jejuni]|nr:hemerythrin domain-containing protein [Campylobacter jejuni]
MSIKWSEDFSIQNAHLDKQHEIIFEIANAANELSSKFPNDDEKYNNELKKNLVKLFHYIKIHFKDEEKFMQDINFPLFEEHQQSHQILIAKTKELLNYSDDTIKMAEKFSILVNDWILNHFANEDLWMSNFRSKAIHLKEIHYTLEQYIKLKSIKQDLSKEKFHDYICSCFLYTHAVPETIHQELENKGSTLKCEKCNQILVHLEDFDLNQKFEELDSTLQSIIKDYHLHDKKRGV